MSVEVRQNPAAVQPIRPLPRLIPIRRLSSHAESDGASFDASETANKAKNAVTLVTTREEESKKAEKKKVGVASSFTWQSPLVVTMKDPFKGVCSRGTNRFSGGHLCSWLVVSGGVSGARTKNAALVIADELLRCKIIQKTNPTSTNDFIESEMYQFSASPRSTSTGVSPAPTTNGSPWRRNRPRRRQAAANCPSSSSSSSDSDDKDTTSSPPSSSPPPPPSLLHQRKPLQVHLPPPRLSRLNPIENRNSGGGGGDEQKRGWFPPSLPRLLPINISPSPSPSPPVGGPLAPIQESSPMQKDTGSTSSSSDDAPSSPTAPSLSSPTPRTISPSTVQSMPSLIRKGSGQTVQLENEISSKSSSSPPPRGSIEVATAAAAPASSPSQSLGQLLGVKPSANDPAVIAATAAAATNNADDPLQFASTEPVHEVAMEGNVAELRRLIQAYSVDYPDHGCRTPLMYAVRGGSKKACETLLRIGANVNVRDAYGMSALLWAVYLGKSEITAILLRFGADPASVDGDGRTAFHWSARLQSTKCLKLLLKHGYNLKGLIDRRDKKDLSPLHWAVMGGNHQHVRLLINVGVANFNVVDGDGRTPLNYAVLNYSTKCIRALLECCELAANYRDQKGRTALHYACGEGSVECIRTLTSFRTCDVDCADGRETTPLHWAAAANQPEALRFLLRRGASRDLTDGEGLLPLDHAQQRNHAECVEILTTFYPNRGGGMAAGPSVPPSRRNSLASIVSDAGVTDSVPVPLKVPENPKFSMSSSSPPDLKQTAPTAPTDSNFEQKEGKEPKKSSVFRRLFPLTCGKRSVAVHPMQLSYKPDQEGKA